MRHRGLFTIALTTMFMVAWFVALTLSAREAAQRQPDVTLLVVFPDILNYRQSAQRVIDAGGYPLQTVAVPFLWAVAPSSQEVVGKLAADGALVMAMPRLPVELTICGGPRLPAGSAAF